MTNKKANSNLFFKHFRRDMIKCKVAALLPTLCGKVGLNKNPVIHTIVIF